MGVPPSSAVGLSWAQLVHCCLPRLYNLPPTAPMGGGTLLFEGAHLIDVIHPDLVLFKGIEVVLSVQTLALVARGGV